VDPFTIEEREAIIAGLRRYAPLYANYVICGFWTGWRPNEACALKWNRVDFQQGKILIRVARMLRHKSPVITLERNNRLVPNLTQTDGKVLLAAGRTGERFPVVKKI
jgi:integrase